VAAPNRSAEALPISDNSFGLVCISMVPGMDYPSRNCRSVSLLIRCELMKAILSTLNHLYARLILGVAALVVYAIASYPAAAHFMTGEVGPGVSASHIGILMQVSFSVTEESVVTRVEASLHAAPFDKDDSLIPCETACCGTACTAGMSVKPVVVQHLLGTVLVLTPSHDAQVNGFDPPGLTRPPSELVAA